MNRLLIGLILLISSSVFGSDYAVIECRDSFGNNSWGTYLVETSPEVVTTDKGEIAFSVRVQVLLGSNDYYIDKNCSDSQKQYKTGGVEFLLCGAGSKIKYNKGPFCYGRKVARYIKK